MRHDTVGRRQLLHVLQRVKAIEVARICRVSKSAVSHWANGSCRPSEVSRDILATRYKIPAESWFKRIAA